MSTDLEDLLREMPLRRPSALLDERVRTAGPGGGVAWKSALAAGVIAAALFSAWLIASRRPGGREAGGLAGRPPAGAPGPLRPVRFEQNSSDLWYEGLLLLDDHTPMRQYRQETVHEVRWIDPESGSAMEMTVPVETVFLVSAKTQ